MSESYKILAGVSMFALGQLLGWFQLNSQLMWEWWSEKPFMSAIIFGIPTSMCFWFGWKLLSSALDSVWSARFIGSCIGLMIFPILTWAFLGESMFTVKTLSCFSLSIIIILIQVFT